MSDQPQQNPNIPPPHYLDEESISFSDIFLFLARHLRVIIFTPTVFCILAIINVFFIATPVYKSTSKVMSSSGSAGVSQAVGIAAQFGISIPTGNSEPNWAYPEIIKSRTLARSIIKRKFSIVQNEAPQSLLQILTDENVEYNSNGYTKKPFNKGNNSQR